MPTRHRNAEIARETLAILNLGGYTNALGRRVDLAADLRRAIDATTLYGSEDFPHDFASPRDVPRPGTVIEVTAETTLQAARRIWEAAGVEPFCLNFASAKNPGGGFLNGAQAQEESLARSSGLYPCIHPVRGYYDHHRSLGTTLYSDHMIYSPAVPVFRDDGGALLDAPHPSTFLTSAAVNAGAFSGGRHVVELAMRTRLLKMLSVALRRSHTHLVLGAWGCGVFRNHPAMIAALFRDALGPGGPYAGIFPTVVFAVFDPSDDRSTFRAFRDALASAESSS